MTCEAKVLLHWLVGTHPSNHSPRGQHFVRPARFDHQADDWQKNAWSLVVDVEGVPDAEGYQVATARFLADEAPQDWLSKGRRFKLFEEDAFADGEVTAVRSVMNERLFAVLPNSTPSPKVKHYIGSPPEVTGAKDTRQEMGPALFLVIYQKPDGVFLYRYDAGGNFVGDTWHQSITEAKEQATYEYEGVTPNWQNVSAEVEDAVAFVLARLKHISAAP